MLLGVIADDLTGATDVALMLSRNGMKTVQTIGVPTADQSYGGADAVVVALKSRTIPAAEAVAMSLEAAAALRSAGAEQFLFKYCSTFDSTDAGNIGPVAEALLEFLGRRSHDRLPGVSRQRPLDLSRASVRRADVAVRQSDEGPSADADARRQSRARAAASGRRARSG